MLLECENVSQSIVNAAREHLRDGMHFVAYLTEFQIIIGVTQPVWEPDADPNCSASADRKRFGSCRLALDAAIAASTWSSCEQAEEKRRQIAKRFVQATRLWRTAAQQTWFQTIENCVPAFVRHDVKRATGEYGLRFAPVGVK